MVLHKFALLGGKVPAATGMRAAGRPPKAGRRTLFAAAAAPPGLRPAGCPENPAPTGRSDFRLVFIGRCSLFAAYVFCTDFALFAAGTERIARPPQGQANGLFLATLAACRFWAFAVGKDSPHPRKEKQSNRFYPPSPSVDFEGCSGEEKMVPVPRKGKPMGRFYPPLPLVDFGLLRWGRMVPIPARARQTDGFIIPYRPVLPTAG